jgi:hypothetical protein
MFYSMKGLERSLSITFYNLWEVRDVLPFAFPDMKSMSIFSLYKHLVQYAYFTFNEVGHNRGCFHWFYVTDNASW